MICRNTKTALCLDESGALVAYCRVDAANEASMHLWPGDMRHFRLSADLSQFHRDKLYG